MIGMKQMALRLKLPDISSDQGDSSYSRGNDIQGVISPLYQVRLLSHAREEGHHGVLFDFFK